MENQETNPKTPHLGTVESSHERQLKEEDGKSESNVDAWVDSVDQELEKNKSKTTCNSGKFWIIHRVPRNLCQDRDSTFHPRIISIGPMHYDEGLKLKLMEGHKDRFLMRLLEGKFDLLEDDDQSSWPLSMGDDENRRPPLLKDLVEAMKKLERRTRECYSEDFDKSISSDQFVRMMVRDGCFVVQLLRLYSKFDEAKGKPKEHLAVDSIFNARWMLRTLQRDLLKLENQLPYFVLEKLFKLTSGGQEKMALEELIVTFFDPLSPRKDATSKLNRALTVDGKKLPYAHMLDVFRSTFLMKVRDKMQKNGWTAAPQLHSDNSLLYSHYNHVETPRPPEKQLIHFMSELQEAGVKLKKGEGQDLLDIAFEGRTLHMPPFFIDNNSVPLFLNFIAYEQCDERAKPFFTNYFMFLDSLINGSDDVDILHKQGIINHVLGSTDNVAELLNKLCREIVYDKDQCYLSNEMNAINHHCERYNRSMFRRWWGYLISKYFSSPWTLLSLFAAIVFLILAVVQTTYAVYPYYHPSSKT